MYTVIKQSGVVETIKHVDSIPSYSFFIGSLVGYGENALWMKAFNTVVCLEGVKGTWDRPAMEFTNYRPVDVEIHVKEQK
jgi:hypothetical protein